MRSWEWTEKGAQGGHRGTHRLWVGRRRPVTLPHLLCGKAPPWQDRECPGAQSLQQDRGGRRRCTGTEHAETRGVPSLAREARPPCRRAKHYVLGSAHPPHHLISPLLLVDRAAQGRRQRTRARKEWPRAMHLYDRMLLSRPRILSHTSSSDLAKPPGGTLVGSAWESAMNQRESAGRMQGPRWDKAGSGG